MRRILSRGLGMSRVGCLGLGILLVVSGLGCSTAQKYTVSVDAEAEIPLDQMGAVVENFHIVERGKVYRGAAPGKLGIAGLSKAGIRTIVDLQGGDRILGLSLGKGESDQDIEAEGRTARQSGIQFVSKPLASIHPSFGSQSSLIEEILGIVTNPSSQPVFFHCRHGQDRTGLIAALYRVLYQGCTPKQAAAEMLQLGHSQLMPWIDRYFEERIQKDHRTHVESAGSSCPLR